MNVFLIKLEFKAKWCPAKLYAEWGNCYKTCMYYVYILQSQKDQSYYTGVTTDLKKRIQDHNWHQTKSTSTKAPYHLVWYCAFKNKKRAYDFEKYLKSSSGFAFRNKHFI